MRECFPKVDATGTVDSRVSRSMNRRLGSHSDRSALNETFGKTNDELYQQS